VRPGIHRSLSDTHVYCKGGCHGCSTFAAILAVRACSSPDHTHTPLLQLHKKDYDLWANEFGCTGWSYEEVLPYFRKSEHRFVFRVSCFLVGRNKKMTHMCIRRLLAESSSRGTRRPPTTRSTGEPVDPSW
jgi:choline dehydrogenase-like flavoprotein